MVTIALDRLFSMSKTWFSLFWTFLRVSTELAWLLKGNQRTEPSNKLWRKTILSPLLIYNKSSDSQREVSQEDTWHSPTVGSLKVNLIMEQLEVKLSAVTRDDAEADELMRTKLNPSKFAKLIR